MRSVTTSACRSFFIGWFKSKRHSHAFRWIATKLKPKKIILYIKQSTVGDCQPATKATCLIGKHLSKLILHGLCWRGFVRRFEYQASAPMNVINHQQPSAHSHKEKNKHQQEAANRNYLLVQSIEVSSFHVMINLESWFLSDAMDLFTILIWPPM